MCGKSRSMWAWTIPNHKRQRLRSKRVFRTTRPEFTRADLEKIQRSFGESLKKNEADAVINDASEDICVYRRGEFPAVGKTAAEKMLGEKNAKTTRTPLGAGTSDAIDLAYEYGEYASERNHRTLRGIYLCIWRLESDGALENSSRSPEDCAGEKIMLGASLVAKPRTVADACGRRLMRP